MTEIILIRLCETKQEERILMARDSTSRPGTVNFRLKMAASSLVDVVERIVSTASYVIMLNIITHFMTGSNRSLHSPLIAINQTIGIVIYCVW